MSCRDESGGARFIEDSIGIAERDWQARAQRTEEIKSEAGARPGFRRLFRILELRVEKERGENPHTALCWLSP